jgi:hypothetical protein
MEALPAHRSYPGLDADHTVKDPDDHTRIHIGIG